jgi:predicted transcriptional regulator
MEIELTPDHKTRLDQLAARDGRTTADIIREAIDRYLDDETRFAAAVMAGVEAADRGDFVPAEEVWDRVERTLRS